MTKTFRGSPHRRAFFVSLAAKTLPPDPIGQHPEPAKAGFLFSGACMRELTLTRFAYTPMGAFGRLELPSGADLYTVERPWLSNRQRESCIPEGRYAMGMRESGVVSRSTGGEYTKGWEVQDVPGRTYIMLHPGNTMDDLLGCIAPGLDLGFVGGRWAVTQSRDAFRRLMGELAHADEWMLHIRPFRAEYP